VATVQAIVDSLEIHIRDTGNAEVTEARLVTLIADASQDADLAGGLVYLEDDESLTLASPALSYTVPANFVAIRELRIEGATADTYDRIVPRHLWQLRYDSANPKIVFHEDHGLTDTKKIKIVGWRRPTVYSAVGNTVDPGLDAFLRDRAAAYALSYMSAGGSELDRNRLQQRELKMRDSEVLLQRYLALQAEQLVPGTRRVPSR
jgi:hypothetical protein